MQSRSNMAASNTSNNSQGNTKLVTEVQNGDSVRNININKLAKSVPVWRSCAILINNHHRELELTAPKSYLYSGLCQIPPPPLIRPGFLEVCLYRKKIGSFYGTSGVLSFNINHVYVERGNDNVQYLEKSDHDGTSLFLMWSVPAGINTTYQAVGITKDKELSYDLFKTMYGKNQNWFIKSTPEDSLEFSITAYEIPIRVLASISSVGNATWKIDIC